MRFEDMNPLQRAEHAVEFYESLLATFAERGLNTGEYPKLLEQAQTRLNNLLVGDANMTSVMRALSMSPEDLSLEAEFNRREQEMGF